MRIPPVSPIDRTRSTDKTRESFARRVNGPFVPRTSRSGWLPAEERTRPRPRRGRGSMSSSPARRASEVQNEAADDVGLRALAGLLTKVDRLLERVGSFVL